MAVADAGIEGDRYFRKIRKGKPFAEGAITLIETEAIEAAELMTGRVFGLGETRRNITTRGIRLNDFVGKTLRIGDAVIRGFELCDPCARLEKLTGKPMLKALHNRGGLRAYIVQTGSIKVGDAILALGPSTTP